MATVSGGLDMGSVCASQTYSCRDCGVLFDRLVSNTPRHFNERDVPQNMPCEARPGHSANLWNDPGPCPKCESTLRKKELVVCWD
jgi:hypothetical protein